MSSIELTDTQRQVLQRERGNPVQVVDPASQERYVLLAWEHYERVRSLLEAVPHSAAPAAAPRPSLPAGVGAPRQRIRDLPLPPEVAAQAKHYCKQLGWRGAASLRQVEEQMKLQYYYGGKWIALRQTDEGPLVVAVAESLRDPSFDRQLSSLTPDERRHLRYSSPPRLFDTESEILTPFADES
jgi:hypothetical protein